ncbi:hypothetical protein Taro_050436 [Colocasia esculenta]|uniref:Uncharacterized protein n=1 Tax=Colocasia esculenta TaxID=4460 RepID=A0A843XDE7_COLES|nr:hypothetical protein [Colocasia esculenta]
MRLVIVAGVYNSSIAIVTAVYPSSSCTEIASPHRRLEAASFVITKSADLLECFDRVRLLSVAIRSEIPHLGRTRRPGRDVVAPEWSATTALGRTAPGRRVLIATEVAVSDACSVDAAYPGIVTAFPVSEIVVLEASVLRWCCPARAGDVFVPFGARRRRSFLREGPSGFVLRVEVGTLDPLALSMLPSPLYIMFPLWFGAWECENSLLEVDMRPSPYGLPISCFGTISGKRVPELPPAENATPLETAILSRWPGRPRQDRGALGHRDLVATARAVVTKSRWGRASRPCRDGSMRRDLSRETAQQQQGAHRAEETGRHSQARQLVEQQDESVMPMQGQVQEEVSADESIFRNLYQGAYQPRQVAAGVQFPVPPPVVSKQQVEPEVEQLEHQQRSGTGSTRAGRRRTTVTEDRTALLERFLHLRPLMFHGEFDPDKAESWTHELERIFEAMECAEEDQGHARRLGHDVVGPELSAVTALGHAAPGRRVLVATGVAVSDACSVDTACLGIGTTFLVSECENSMLEVDMLPSPCGLPISCFGTIFRRRVPKLPPAKNATPLEAAILSGWPGRPRQDRGALGHHDLVAIGRRDHVATARCVVTSAMRQISDPCHFRFFYCETSQQRQGTRRAEETGR